MVAVVSRRRLLGTAIRGTRAAAIVAIAGPIREAGAIATKSVHGVATRPLIGSQPLLAGIVVISVSCRLPPPPPTPLLVLVLILTAALDLGLQLIITILGPILAQILALDPALDLGKQLSGHSGIRARESPAVCG